MDGMFMVLQRLRANAIVLSAWRGVAWPGLALRRAALVHGRYHRSFSRAPRETSLAGFVCGGLRVDNQQKKKQRACVSHAARVESIARKNTVRIAGVASDRTKGKTEAGTYGLDGANKQRCINPKHRQCCDFFSLEVKEEVRRILASDQRAAAWDHSSRHAGRSTSTGGNLEASDGGLGLGWRGNLEDSVTSERGKLGVDRVLCEGRAGIRDFEAKTRLVTGRGWRAVGGGQACKPPFGPAMSLGSPSASASASGRPRIRVLSTLYSVFRASLKLLMRRSCRSDCFFG